MQVLVEMFLKSFMKNRAKTIDDKIRYQQRLQGRFN